MTNNKPTAVLDTLSSKLKADVARATETEATAALAARFERMHRNLIGVIGEISECVAALDSPLMELPDRAFLEQKREVLASQLTAIRTEVTEDPSSVLRGESWTRAQKSMESLDETLAAARESAYSALMNGFYAGDRELLETLPAGIQGVSAYQNAIAEFERLAAKMPSTAKEVAEAAATGRRLKKCREQVERDAVPSEFKEDWHAMRSGGLPLSDLGDDLRVWLKEQDLETAVVLRYESQ